MHAPLSISLPDGTTVSAIRTAPSAPTARWQFVYAPGAGANLTDGFGCFAAERLATAGIATLRFQFPYAEQGRRLPDRRPVLEATWRAAIATATNGRMQGVRTVVGGRSMGGRMASYVVAGAAGVDALALFAYPLHPPGQPDRLRIEHFPRISIPTLFCSGTNDTFATEAELRAAVEQVPDATVRMLDGADHGFRVPKRTGRTQEDIWASAVDALVAWLAALSDDDARAGRTMGRE